MSKFTKSGVFFSILQFSNYYVFAAHSVHTSFNDDDCSLG